MQEEKIEDLSTPYKSLISTRY